MLDSSPADEPPIESAMPWPSGPVTRETDVDGSVSGCELCGRPFALMDSVLQCYRVGRLPFRHVKPCI